MSTTMISRDGHHGVQPWVAQPGYKTFRSKYGPNYTTESHIHGWSLSTFRRVGFTAAAFGGVAGTFALFFFCDVPRVRKDIMQRIPLISGYFIREVPPEDNPF